MYWGLVISLSEFVGLSLRKLNRWASCFGPKVEGMGRNYVNWAVRRLRFWTLSKAQCVQGGETRLFEFGTWNTFTGSILGRETIFSSVFRQLWLNK